MKTQLTSSYSFCNSLAITAPSYLNYSAALLLCINNQLALLQESGHHHKITNPSTLAMANAAGSVPSHLNMPRRHAKKPTVVPVGLNFGPTQLSITFFTEQSVYYTGVPCGEVYKTFFQDALSQEVPCHFERRHSKGLFTPAVSSSMSSEDITELVETISRHIKSAISMGISALDHNPALDFQLMAITVPDHWGASARTHAATASKLAGYPLDGSHMIIPLSRATQLAFQMTRYTEGRYLTLLLDYNKSYLHLMLVEMCGTDCVVKGQVYFPQLGEDELHKAPVVGSAVVSAQGSATHNAVNRAPSDGAKSDDESTSSSSTNDSSGSDLIFPMSGVYTSNFSTGNTLHSDQPVDEHPTAKEKANDSNAVPDEFETSGPVCHNKAAHFKPVLNVVCELLVQTTAPTAGHLKHAFHDVKYIVIDGEVSRPGLQDLRDAVKSEFINEEWIQVEGNKRDCGAYGAAVIARQQFQNPKHMDNWKNLPGYVPGSLR